MSAALVRIAPVVRVRASALPEARAARIAARARATSRRFESASPLRTSSGTARSRGDAVRVRVAHPDEGFTDGNPLATAENMDLEMKVGRAAMVGFFFTTVGDVVTRGAGPVEQLRDEQTFLMNHINPAMIAKDALEVAGIYVESVFIVWLCLAAAFILAVQQGLASPVRTYSSKKSARRAELEASGERLGVMLASVKDALDVQVREQKPYELFNGRLAMLGFAFALVGEAVTKQGPLEQFNLETGVPVIDEELFGAFFLLGVVFNVVATGANVGKTAWAKGKSVNR